MQTDANQTKVTATGVGLTQDAMASYWSVRLRSVLSVCLLEAHLTLAPETQRQWHLETPLNCGSWGRHRDRQQCERRHRKRQGWHTRDTCISARTQRCNSGAKVSIYIIRTRENTIDHIDAYSGAQSKNQKTSNLHISLHATLNPKAAFSDALSITYE